jgi:hypothetical protein
VTTPSPPPPFRPTTSTWIVGALAVVVLIIAASTSGISGFLIWLALFGLATGIYVLATGRASWARLPSRGMGAIVTGVAVVLIIVGGAVAPATPHAIVKADDHSQTSHKAAATQAKPTPTPTPTPTPVAIDNVAGKSPSDAQSALEADGFIVSFVDSNGATVSDPSGWKVTREAPTAGTGETPGSVVTLTVQKPAPPKPKPKPKPVYHAPPAPSHGGATALCRDGTLSYSAHHRGTCSHHGGVRTWYR